MNYLLMWFSGFTGALTAIVGYLAYQNYKKTKAMLEFYKEFKKSVEDEMTFVEIANKLSKEMNYDD